MQDVVPHTYPNTSQLGQILYEVVLMFSQSIKNKMRLHKYVDPIMKVAQTRSTDDLP